MAKLTPHRRTLRLCLRTCECQSPSFGSRSLEPPFCFNRNRRKNATASSSSGRHGRLLHRSHSTPPAAQVFTSPSPEQLAESPASSEEDSGGTVFSLISLPFPSPAPFFHPLHSSLLACKPLGRLDRCAGWLDPLCWVARSALRPAWLARGGCARTLASAAVGSGGLSAGARRTRLASEKISQTAQLNF
ncbi:hypothetical protein ZEAMMB73_Zm00001d000065 [Zea mays]|nr:hypothetical protein ZEAMMB73_Zm00001d000065 [Zea mays]